MLSLKKDILKRILIICLTIKINNYCKERLALPALQYLAKANFVFYFQPLAEANGNEEYLYIIFIPIERLLCQKNLLIFPTSNLQPLTTTGVSPPSQKSFRRLL
jgi:hypothetical protein